MSARRHTSAFSVPWVSLAPCINKVDSRVLDLLYVVVALVVHRSHI